jgi:hypothetical protein
MSTPVLASQLGEIEAARQQLDELDALLERMLALPACQPEGDPFGDLEEIAPTPSSRRQVAAGDLAIARRTYEEAKSWSQPVEYNLVGSAAASDVAATENSTTEAVSIAQVPDEEEAIGPEVTGADPGLGNPANSFELVEVPHPSTAEVSPPTGRGPLVFIDRVFEECVAPLGYLGRWLMSATGKSALGGIGLLLLAGALAWAMVDWLLWNW